MNTSISKFNVKQNYTKSFFVFYKNSIGNIGDWWLVIGDWWLVIGCGGRIWTNDLQVMSLTSYQTAPPRDNKDRLCVALYTNYLQHAR